mgnify:CR=1 FL=1
MLRYILFLSTGDEGAEALHGIPELQTQPGVKHVANLIQQQANTASLWVKKGTPNRVDAALGQWVVARACDRGRTSQVHHLRALTSP